MNRSLRINIPAIYLMGFFHSFMVMIPIFVPLFLLVIVGLSSRIRREGMVATPQPAH